MAGEFAVDPRVALVQQAWRFYMCLDCCMPFFGSWHASPSEWLWLCTCVRWSVWLSREGGGKGFLAQVVGAQPPDVRQWWRELPLVEAPDVSQPKMGYKPPLTLVYDWPPHFRLFVGGRKQSLYGMVVAAEVSQCKAAGCTTCRCSTSSSSSQRWFVQGALSALGLDCEQGLSHAASCTQWPQPTWKSHESYFRQVYLGVWSFI